ncbi:MAG TPA: TIGR03621 family F420-dependent LLM class oxidoreductase [Acidimicrobiales bacterium]|nr:TIGR03621 family F420-dependent LLM class oxidoreductase [Acidimicrobiales bacterium]
MSRPFRFAVQTSSAPDAKTWRQRARDAESMGYSTLYIPDHFGEQWGPLVGLTVAAEATERLNVGALVFDNDYRHPVVLAKEAATLDVVSEGRFELGIGAGWLRSDYEQSGLPYDRPGVRIERLAESLAIMKALWTDGKASFSGEHYTVTDAIGDPRPHTRPHPRVCIGGGGRRVLSLAAREADIVGFNATLTAGYVGPEAAATATAEQFDQRVAWVRQAAGERLGQIELQCHTSFVAVTEDRRSFAEDLAPAFEITVEEALEIPLVLVGTIEQMCEQLIERRERYGFSYWVVSSDSGMEAFAPVVERLAGT